MNKGKIHVLPTPISENALTSIPPLVIQTLHQLKYFLVEKARTTRRYISSTNPPHPISELNIIEIDKTENKHIEVVMKWLNDGKDVGLLSESGMPSIADPGTNIISFAHENNIQVIPYVGPSSITMALAASGLNGQNFCFNGYLPIKEKELLIKLKQLEQKVIKEKQAQIFIETPYRNDRLLHSLISHLNNQIKLCVARDITGESESIITRTIFEWKEINSFEIGKTPCIFLLGI